MALNVHGFENGATSSYKIVQETSSGTTLVENATGGSGRIYCITLTNTDNSNGGFTKFFLSSATTPTVGTTEPDLLLVCGSNTTERYEFPAGLPFTVLSFYTSRELATSDTTAPGTTKVVILCS
tara:strand:- start:807 stop:1178 length:372 start_codon:yes stop_codon:yes gene_type:complete